MHLGEPKKRQSDTAYDGLRAAIIKAELMPGAAIDERQCMEMLGVGRTPLREALQRLAQEDLLLAVPQRGYFVSSTSAADFFHLNEFRLHSEALAARMAAMRIDDAQLLEFDALMEEARAGIAARRMEIEWHLGVDERMHRLVARASGNPYLAQSLNRLYALSVRSLYVARVPVTLIFDELENFAAIRDALAARDPDRAEIAMRNHLTVSVVQMVRPAGVPSSKTAGL
ncbi:GntR family transcriptional regulator [Mesorhizobium sp. DCY119]|jgi:DNA-binding GntR family transcriptional regulator|uniref:GntR family transcriptional regulator n=1 Tax=Mesorhizobium sp. DCY119 TaxID=2108445 RepID=UPI000E7522B3|nr:GntR family transcriptional regulator [Mesorhizobium sp. DCY119]RJG41322.1 GntR family transcriptional regulator [Mesorhizobium sp. DCY119]